MSDTSQGDCVEVPFDECIVKYLWVSERVFEIVDVELKCKNKYVLIEQEKLAAALLLEEQNSGSGGEGGGEGGVYTLRSGGDEGAAVGGEAMAAESNNADLPVRNLLFFSTFCVDDC